MVALPPHTHQRYTDARTHLYKIPHLPRTVYFFNFATGESQWDHPLDAHFRALFETERRALAPPAAPPLEAAAGMSPVTPALVTLTSAFCCRPPRLCCADGSSSVGRGEVSW